MHESDESRTTRAEDARVQAAVLEHLVALHPTLLTVDELVREIAGEEPSFSERDAVERAVRDLAAVGLLNRSQELVMPSRAALRFDELLNR